MKCQYRKVSRKGKIVRVDQLKDGEWFHPTWDSESNKYRFVKGTLEAHYLCTPMPSIFKNYCGGRLHELDWKCEIL